MNITYLNPRAQDNHGHPTTGAANDTNNRSDSSKRRAVEIAPGLWFFKGGVEVEVIDFQDLGSRPGPIEPIHLCCLYCSCYYFEDPDDDPDPATPAQAAWCQLQQPSLAVIGRLRNVPNKPCRPASGGRLMLYRVPLPIPDRVLPQAVPATAMAEVDCAQAIDKDGDEDEEPERRRALCIDGAPCLCTQATNGDRTRPIPLLLNQSVIPAPRPPALAAPPRFDAALTTPRCADSASSSADWR